MTCDLCNGTGYVMQDIGTATVPDYVEVACRCNPEPTDEDAPNWLDDPDFIIEGESVLYVPKGWPDDFGHTPAKPRTAHSIRRRRTRRPTCTAPNNHLSSITDDLHDTHALSHALKFDLIPRKPAGVCPGWRALPIDH